MLSAGATHALARSCSADVVLRRLPILGVNLPAEVAGFRTRKNAVLLSDADAFSHVHYERVEAGIRQSQKRKSGITFHQTPELVRQLMIDHSDGAHLRIVLDGQRI